MASTAASVAATSAPSDRPCTTDVPSASAASSTERWEIDFSPGVRTVPWQGTPPVDDQRGRACVTTAAPPGSGSPRASTAAASGGGVGVRRPPG